MTTPPSVAKPVSPLLYPALLIAGVTLIVASLLGIVAMSGWLSPMDVPQAPGHEERAAARPVQSAGKVVAQPRTGACASGSTDPCRRE